MALPVARSPLVTPSTPAVRTHVACSGPLPVPFPTTPVDSHPKPRQHIRYLSAEINRLYSALVLPQEELDRNQPKGVFNLLFISINWLQVFLIATTY
jgi:hypothetical protein